MSISTCALREEGDRCLPTTRCVDSYFYPRPPRGGRRGSAGDHHPLRNFYPRPPRGGRRCGAACFHLHDMISIHALREEGDVCWKYNRPWQISSPALREAGDSAHLVKSGLKLYFYPRPPRGGRHHRPYSQYLQQNISIHALREEGDR